MVKVTAPLVGAAFRPPAKAILNVLPTGCPLYLEREPENAYDPHAIKVLVEPKDIPTSQHEHLAGAAIGYGTSLEEILSAKLIHLGYVDSKKTGSAKRWSEAFEAWEQSGDPGLEWPYPAALSFDMKGLPEVNVNFPENS